MSGRSGRVDSANGGTKEVWFDLSATNETRT